MTRLELWSALGRVSVVEPVLVNAYSAEEEEIWRSGSGESPHGLPWHTSFHASAFPGDDPVACGRAQVYSLLGPPEDSPISPHLRSIFDVGKNLELDWVRRFSFYGVLLSADQTAGDDLQTAFADHEHWLTGSSDAIILPPHWTRGHCVEIKTTSHEKVMAMLQGEPPPKSHAKYQRQLATYIALAYESGYSPIVVICAHSGIQINSEIKRCRGGHEGDCEPQILQVQPPIDGTLIYSSREEPMKTASFFQGYDPQLMAVGRAKLAEWRDAFLNDEIPPHPHEGQKSKWSVPPCEYCRYKSPLGGSKGGCKEDYAAKRTKLSESALIEFAKSARPSYSYKDARAAVFRRWGIQDPAESS